MSDFVIIKGVLTKYTGKDTNVVIPDGVTKIGYQAFSGCSSLVSVTIPGSVTEIGNNAFVCCSNLVSVTMPDSVTKIGRWAFSGCSSLKNVTIPDGVTSIGENAFYGCKNLKDVYISEKTVKLGKEILGKYDSDISCHVVKTSDVYVHTPAGSAAEKYMKQYSGVYVVNDYGEDK